MNRTIAQATLSAVAFASAAGLWMFCLSHRRRKVGKDKRDLRTQLKTWEGEGGNLAPGSQAVPSQPA